MPIDRIVLGRLREIVGDAHVVTDPDVLAGFVTDWTGRFRGDTVAVVRPGSTAEVAAVLIEASRAGVAVLPQGGNTGLVGASVPLHGELVLSLGRLNRLEIDAGAGQALAGAGVTIGALAAAAENAGWAYGVDLASRDSCTVGGTIATNAGGLRVVRYGDTRAQLIGIEAVLSDGTVVSHLAGLPRDNTGYHLPSLLAGSEGTLAVVTAARLRLVGTPLGSAVAALGSTSVAAAVRTAAVARGLSGCSAVELFLPEGLDLVRAHAGLPRLLSEPAAAYLLIEADGTADDLAQWVAELDEVTDAVLADDSAGKAALWAYRERHTEAISGQGPVIKLDVALPLTEAATFLTGLVPLVRSIVPAANAFLFGHMADGNVHTNITAVPPDRAHEVEDLVLRWVAELGGSIAAEHGVGHAKREWLSLNRSASELDVFGRIRLALDPTRTLSPHTLW